MVTTSVMLSDLIRRLALGRVELDVVAELGKCQKLARRLPQLRPILRSSDYAARSLRL
jgi:hypothetical protein